MDCSMPGFPVLHHLLEFAQSHVHWVGDASQPSHPLSSPSPPAFNLPQQIPKDKKKKKKKTQKKTKTIKLLLFCLHEVPTTYTWLCAFFVGFVSIPADFIVLSFSPFSDEYYCGQHHHLSRKKEYSSVLSIHVRARQQAPPLYPFSVLVHINNPHSYLAHSHLRDSLRVPASLLSGQWIGNKCDESIYQDVPLREGVCLPLVGPPWTTCKKAVC